MFLEFFQLKKVTHFSYNQVDKIAKKQSEEVLFC